MQPGAIFFNLSRRNFCGFDEGSRAMCSLEYACLRRLVCYFSFFAGPLRRRMYYNGCDVICVKAWLVQTCRGSRTVLSGKEGFEALGTLNESQLLASSEIFLLHSYNTAEFGVPIGMRISESAELTSLSEHWSLAQVASPDRAACG
eukprot:gnl/TRDRNA2_/TRDRNA2_174100_c0_seq14.p1 gnl/TRDRNA2_/TRDRNA2_174100_c0~~gnl/TRDRNA2_/TRDRNA2_174100_c0_seq14.p1  ORF type:complete len:146 (-),score=9.00 gnl/TRDRNA2_/TRDRNA2_174100_c0_seq14:258-695(-)